MPSTTTPAPESPSRPSSGEGTRADVAGERDLRVLAGVISGLVGAMMLIVPHQFSSPAYVLVARSITAWGIVFLLSGTGLILADVLQARRSVLRALHVVVGATWLFLGLGYMVPGGLIGMTAWGVFGLGIGLAPWFSEMRAGAGVPSTPSALSLVNAATATTIGVAAVVMVVGAQLRNPIFSGIRVAMISATTSMVASAPLLLFVLLRPPARRWPWFWGAHLVVGGCYLLYGVGIAWVVHAWTGVVLYSGLGISLLLAPVLQDRLRRVPSNSLPVRMSVVVSIALTIALVALASLASWHFASVHGVEEDGLRSLRESTFAVLLLSLAVAVAAIAYTSRWVAAPLRALAGAARELAAGEGTARLPDSDVGEVQDLVASFSEMRDRLAARTLEREQSLARLEERTEELRAAKESAEVAFHRLRGLESLRDSLVHMIVHDLISPLAATDALLEFLRRAEEERLSEDARSALQECRGAVARMKSMARSVLDVSKMEAGAMRLTRQRFDLAEICRDLLAGMRGIVEERKVVLDAEGAAPVQADVDLVTRVVQNLIANALKFTARNGEIRAVIRAEGEVLRFSLTDTGPGVPREFQEKIFEKFGQVEAHSAGLRKSAGLGLTFCKMAVEAHGGRIGVESDGKRGSTFWFTLPR